MSWISWQEMAKQKAEGDLCYREIVAFNQALLAKQAWRVLTNPNCLLARVLTGKYCSKKSFLEVATPPSCSHGRDLLKAGLGKVIGNGLTTKVWQDSWISLSHEMRPFGPTTKDNKDLRVADFLTIDHTWNTIRIEEKLPLLSTQILALRPSLLESEDAYI